MHPGQHDRRTVEQRPARQTARLACILVVRQTRSRKRRVRYGNAVDAVPHQALDDGRQVILRNIGRELDNERARRSANSNVLVARRRQTAEQRIELGGSL